MVDVLEHFLPTSNRTHFMHAVLIRGASDRTQAGIEPITRSLRKSSTVVLRSAACRFRPFLEPAKSAYVA
ncbi:hypothetical protein MPC4_50033 [Methylocella tundrae]|uniref:Uncharacterized protein n=1 Tax=Methylocella tundrae TaxID=227605 RepID=A0A8B6MB13_METTU|nr:hypothetical protein MPC4_50033 [Methylocella tundrae]